MILALVISAVKYFHYSNPHLSNLYPKYACLIHYLDILKDEGFLVFIDIL